MALAPLALASVLLAASPALAQMGDMGGGMGQMGGMGDMGGGGGPGGGGHHGGDEGGPPGGGAARPRPPKPMKRKDYDKIVEQMFDEADANHDGTVTVAELHGVVEAKREALIRARFTAVDANHDGTISADEFMVWQKQMGSAASDEDSAFGDRNGPIPDAIMPHTKDEGDRMALRLIEPLTGTVIAKANTNYDAGVSLAELIAYEGKAFEAADKDHDGELSMDELRPMDGPDGHRGGFGGRRGPGGPGEGGPPPSE
ncbi:EF-hand domain-containing protein [Novosphingobium sp. 9]|uniref:EF-hand domain-containing protein n=1 Tax=Novosphingobium sp. 9 TaxID=2025349 RepID=UPI0028CB72AE|nr:EF-hand domain-containing protein [Novosphingobium sp. 9]